VIHFAVLETDRRLEKRRSKAYGRAFGSLTLGAYFTVTGLIGFMTDPHDAMVAGTRWAAGPRWPAVAAGVLLLALGVYLARQLWRTDQRGTGPR
jgi:hypothetical protein